MKDKALKNLIDAEFKPNNNQLGVAIAAIHKWVKEKFQFWKCPPGMGKSRIIAAFITIMCSEYNTAIKTVYIAFSSDILLRTD